MQHAYGDDSEKHSIIYFNDTTTRYFKMHWMVIFYTFNFAANVSAKFLLTDHFLIGNKVRMHVHSHTTYQKTRNTVDDFNLYNHT